MATSLPWSVKGVDPRTRDAAKAAARRAGMTLGEWLDHKIRVESDEIAPEPAAMPEQLDIAALSERLARLSQGQMDTAPASPPKNVTPDLSRGQIDAVISQAAAAEKLTSESSQRTANALDSIARWIEKTETRIVSGERAAAERQERATTVIADAIKTMGERLVDIERKTAEVGKTAEVERQPLQAARPVLHRGGLAAAVTDIRTRQRILDTDEEAMPAQQSVPESRIAALRQDLRSLSARIAPASPPTTPAAQANPIESMIADLGAKLDRLDRRERLEPVLQPLARIETDLSRLSQDRPAESYQRFELEIAHLAAKVDALIARDGNREMLAPVLRDLGELRDMLASQSGEGRFEDLAQQVSTLSSEIGRLREGQPDGREMRNLALAIEDVREAILSDRSRDRNLDAVPLTQLSRQIEALADKVEALPLMRPETLSAQADQLVARLADMDSSGRTVSGALNQRIETLVGKLDALASRQPGDIEGKIDALAGRIEALAASSNLAQLVNENGKVQVAKVDLRPVEEMLRKLAEKIDDAGKPGAESDSFDALEQQISGLANRLDEAVATRSAESGMERTLRDLVVHLQTLREDTTAAAERAARAAVVGVSDRNGPATGFAELSTLVSGLRETHASSGRETQDAIVAVHQTLETVISRLASLETELAAERRGAPVAPPMPPRAAQSRPAVMPAAIIPERIAAEPTMPASAAPDDRIVVERRARTETGPLPGQLDMPLEPGSGRPRAESLATPGHDQQSIRQNLIAAARRSAKAATEAAASSPASSPEAGKSGSRLKEIMEKRRRPLLLAIAAIVLAMGTAHVVTNAIKGSQTPTGSSPVQAPAPAAPEAPAPEAPAKDQSSSLPSAPSLAIAGPAQAAMVLPDITGSTASPTSLAALPPMAGAEPAQAVTGIDDLPAGLGSTGLRKAALSGDARAVYELASRAADSPGAARDPKLAMRLFERAAVAGLAPAQFRLGNMFEKGIGTTKDVSLARVWYTRAAERGNAKAMHNLAVLHAEGVSGKPDYATATEWFRRAAELGVRDSQYNLAILLGRGLGAPADLGQSYLWFAIAAGQGDEDAGRKRDEVAQRLSPTDLASAKLATSNWRPKALDAVGNEVAAPAKGWDEAPGAADKKAAKPARS
ncbi:SEL1-like repeat protein [Bosea sp. PAMC 26642]|uniref:SEL1-like repeat protein n=1 Tax=Bosea sp. (strain PAMC 26642) TaxID=1792307 RepID=UPI0012E8C0C2|nr:SEL1-like repeat protein [Bosea sp. PAMC 26642]